MSVSSPWRCSCTARRRTRSRPRRCSSPRSSSRPSSRPRSRRAWTSFRCAACWRALYVGEAVCFGLLALLASSFSLPLVLALALIDGILMLTARGLSRGAVNAVLRPAGELRAGNGLLNIGFAISSVGGAALGGLLVDQLGVGSALAVDAASFLVIAVLMGTCRHLPGRAPGARAVPRAPALRPEPRAARPGHAAAARRRGARGRCSSP